jgi:hypothetical protein
VSIVSAGGDDTYGTADDSVTFLDTRTFGIADPEGVEVDNDTGDRWIVDGVNNEVARLSPGANGRFDGVTPTGDDTAFVFDVGVLGAIDPEGIGYDYGRKTVVVLDGSSEVIYELDRTGKQLNTVDVSGLNIRSAAGITVGPRSNDPAQRSYYVVARGVDNNSDPSENDGRLYEIAVDLGGSVTPPANAAPVVGAGADLSVTLPATAALAGTVTDDGKPAPAALSSTWSKVSGPGTVAFSNAAALNPTATFGAAGTYVLRLTATDGALTAFDEVTVTVAAGPTVLKRQFTLSGEVYRFAGPNRYTTAVDASQEAWDAPGGQHQAGAVVLARSDLYADSLAAAPLAAAAKAPLLLTTPTSLSAPTLTEIRRILRPGSTVYVLGSTGAISAGVENQVKAAGFTVVRLGGPNRYATAVKVAEQLERLTGRAGTAALTTGLNYPDGLAAGAAAGSFGQPVLLTAGTTVPAETRAFLTARPGTRTVAVGGDAARAGTWTTELTGSDRYATAALASRHWFGATTNAADLPWVVGTATGENWPDALAAGAFMATYRGPLLLTRLATMPAPGLDAVRALETRTPTADITNGAVFGDTGVLSTNVQNQLRTAIR